MSDETTKRAAQEFLAARMAEETQAEEGRLNGEAAVLLAPKVWKHLVDTIVEKCKEWNAITGEESLVCKETILGDIRVRCKGKPQEILVHYDSKKLQVTLKNSARPDNEPDSIFRIEGFDSGRQAQLVRNNLAVNVDVVVLGELRVLAGIGRAAG